MTLGTLAGSTEQRRDADRAPIRVRPRGCRRSRRLRAPLRPAPRPRRADRMRELTDLRGEGLGVEVGRRRVHEITDRMDRRRRCRRPLDERVGDRLVCDRTQHGDFGCRPLLRRSRCGSRGRRRHRSRRPRARRGRDSGVSAGRASARDSTPLSWRAADPRRRAACRRSVRQAPRPMRAIPAVEPLVAGSRRASSVAPVARSRSASHRVRGRRRFPRGAAHHPSLMTPSTMTSAAASRGSAEERERGRNGHGATLVGDSGDCSLSA